MELAVISDSTYRACLPDDPNCLSFYGSESYHCLLARELLKLGHTVHWIAPEGSTDFKEYPNAHFHPIALTFGMAMKNEILDVLTLDPFFKTKNLAKMDGIIDMSASVSNIEALVWYHDYKKYVCYRNGYSATVDPKLFIEQKHFIVPSVQNKEMFKQAGFDAEVIHYGIDSEFYCKGPSNPRHWAYFDRLGVKPGEYWYFGHRPTKEKGGPRIIELAKRFPNETFVVSAHTPIPEHYISLVDLMRAAKENNLTNIKFVPTPQNPEYHYYKRELMREAKGCLSPFDSNIYLEGFGLLSAESVSCGTPILTTQSSSSSELWINRKDGLVVPNDIDAYTWAIENWSTFNFAPENKFDVEDYAKNYINALSKYQS